MDPYYAVGSCYYLANIPLDNVNRRVYKVLIVNKALIKAPPLPSKSLSIRDSLLRLHRCDADTDSVLK
jgi:hypothetical protein